MDEHLNSVVNLLEIFQTILDLHNHFAALETEAMCGRGRTSRKNNSVYHLQIKQSET